MRGKRVNKDLYVFDYFMVNETQFYKKAAKKRDTWLEGNWYS